MSARTSGRTLVALALATTIAMVATASVVTAQSTSSDRAAALSNSYSVQAGADERLRESVERAVAPMNFVLRPVARRRLLALNQPSARVEIIVRDDSVVIRYSNQPELRAKRGGTRPWQNSAGENLTVEVRALASAPAAEPLLVERYTAEDGTRENRWFLDPSTGHARLEVSIASPRLPSPMRLQLSYAVSPARGTPGESPRATEPPRESRVRR